MRFEDGFRREGILVISSKATIVCVTDRGFRLLQLKWHSVGYKSHRLRAVQPSTVFPVDLRPPRHYTDGLRNRRL